MSASEPRGLALPVRHALALPDIPGVQAEPLGLIVTETLSYEEWQAVGWWLGLLRDWTAWALADWLIAGEALFAERVAQGVEVTGRSPATILEYVRVARAFPPSRRRASLSWTHHQVLASRSVEEQEDWLDRAQANRWNIPELRGLLRDAPSLPISKAEVMERVEDVVRDLLAAVELNGNGRVLVPEPVIDRLRLALGEGS